MTDVVVRCQSGPDVMFNGKSYASIHLPIDRLAPGDRWTRIDIWELADGDWVVVRSLENADVPEGLIGECRQINRPEVSPNDPYGRMNGSVETDEDALSAMIGRTMRYLEWSWLAKALAKKQQWETFSSPEFFYH